MGPEGGEPEILGSGTNDYQTPGPMEVGWGGRTSVSGVSRAILVSFLRNTAMFSMSLCTHRLFKDKILSYLLWIPAPGT